MHSFTEAFTYSARHELTLVRGREDAMREVRARREQAAPLVPTGMGLDANSNESSFPNASTIGACHAASGTNEEVG